MEVLINAEQIIPVPEAEEYLIRFREKSNERKTINSSGRDYSTYSYREAIYNKRNLALAVMSDWIEDNQPNTLADLIQVFPSSIHRAIAKHIESLTDNGLNRYHSKEESVITLPSGENIVISNQWSLRRITYLIDKLNEYNFDIEKVVI